MERYSSLSRGQWSLKTHSASRESSLVVAFALLDVADDAQAAWWICLPPAQQSTETSDLGATPCWIL